MEHTIDGIIDQIFTPEFERQLAATFYFGYISRLGQEADAGWSPSVDKLLIFAEEEDALRLYEQTARECVYGTL